MENARTPLYIETAQRLREAVASGRYAGALPSHERLGAELGVSRATIREAIRVLEQSGLVSSRQGAATVINHTHIDAGLEELFSTSELLGRSGYDAGASFSEVRRAVATPGTFPIFAGRPVFLIDRVRTANGTPLVASLDVIEDKGYDEDALRDTLDAGSLLAWLEAEGPRVGFAKTAISAVSAERSLAERLDVAVGAPLLFLEEIAYASDDEPVYYSHDFYRCDIAQFHVIRRRGLA